MTTWIEQLTHDAIGLRAAQQKIAEQQFRELVRELMEEQNVTRQQLADKLECPIKFLNASIAGEISIDLDVMSAILTELGHGFLMKSEPIMTEVK